MNRSLLSVVMALALSTQANAEVYKCIINGKSIYQAAPCPSGSSEPPLKIKATTDSQKAAAAELQEKLANGNKNKANQKARQLEAAKDAQIKSDRQIIRREEEAAIRQYLDKNAANYLLRKH